MASSAITTLSAQKITIAAGVVAHPSRSPSEAVESVELGHRVVRVVGGHPLPTEGSLSAGAAVSALLTSLRASDHVLVLLSGGASSVLESLPEGVSLGDLQRLTLALQHAGADIVELNMVRRALSQLKGGGLARKAWPARVTTLALSDVIGDRPEAIGSGPTVLSPTGPRDALRVLERYRLDAVAPQVVDFLKTQSLPLTHSQHAQVASDLHVIAANRHALEAAARCARELGFRALVMTTALQGEAREVGRVIGGFAASAVAHALPLGAPACLVFGGETTVTVSGNGRGGRNQELALGASLAISGLERVTILSFATDGVDGASEAAGAVVSGETLVRAEALGLSAHQALENNDSQTFFRALGDSWECGPTGTNVNDLVVVLVYR